MPLAMGIVRSVRVRDIIRPEHRYRHRRRAGEPMTRLLLINPNTNAGTTNMMRAIAQAAAPGGTIVDALSAPYGVPLITNPEALEQSARAVQALAGVIATTPPDGVIISAFGDPGLAALRLRLSCAVTGIAEAGMAEAGSGRRPFAVVTTTPDLVGSITALAESYGHGRTFRGVAVTEGDVHSVMGDHATLVEALAVACAHAIEKLGAEALVIGGGPLGQAAQSLSMRFPVPVIAPIPAAVRLAQKRIARGF